MHVPQIDPRAAHAARATFRIVDVREPFEIEGPLGTLSGAENVPLGEIATLEVSPEEDLLLVCRSGKRSALACAALIERGLTRVLNLEGGMIAWNHAGLPLVRRESEDLATLLESITGWLAQVRGSDRDEARAQLETWLDDRKASYAAPSRAALDHLLTRLEETLGGSDAPPDLDLSLAAWRRDLAAV